jgi:hypothetical protein
MVICVGDAADLPTQDVALWQQQKRIALELRPALDHVAIHVNENGSGFGCGRVHGIAVPYAITG